MSTLSFQIENRPISAQTLLLDYAPESFEHQVVSQALAIYNTNKPFFKSVQAKIIIHVNQDIVIQTIPEVTDDIKDMISFLFTLHIK